MTAKLTALERRRREFVDRRDELKRFKELLECNEKPIIAVWGDGGLGKSCLQDRFVHECSRQEIPKAKVVWTDIRNPDYLSIMRTIRDDLGSKEFNRFTDLVNHYTVEGYKVSFNFPDVPNIQVASGAQIEGSEVGSIAGVVINDSHITVPRNDMAVPESERMIRLTDQFLRALAALEQQSVVFFDGVEKATEETLSWIWTELLQGILSRSISQVLFVLCGRVQPEVDREISFFVEEFKLQPLGLEDTVEYLERRGIAEADRTALANLLLSDTRGIPLEIANKVDTYLKFLQQRKDT